VRTVQDGNVDVLSGTVIRLRAATNLPPQTGYVQFDSGRRIWLEPVPGQAALEGEFAAVQSDGYCVRFETIQYPDGSSFKNRTPVKYTLVCRPDEAPVVQLHEPADGVEMGPSDTVRIIYSASDDLSVEAVRLCFSGNGPAFSTVTVAQPRAPAVQNASYAWDLSALPLRGGSVITYYVEADDNWPEVPHTGRSQTRRIVIRGTVPDTGVPGAQERQAPGNGAQREAPQPGTSGAPQPGEARAEQPAAGPVKPGTPTQPQERQPGPEGGQATAGAPPGTGEGSAAARELTEYARRLRELTGEGQGGQQAAPAGSAGGERGTEQVAGQQPGQVGAEGKTGEGTAGPAQEQVRAPAEGQPSDAGRPAGESGERAGRPGGPGPESGQMQASGRRQGETGQAEGSAGGATGRGGQETAGAPSQGGAAGTSGGAKPGAGESGATSGEGQGTGTSGGEGQRSGAPQGAAGASEPGAGSAAPGGQMGASQGEGPSPGGSVGQAVAQGRTGAGEAQQGAQGTVGAVGEAGSAPSGPAGLGAGSSGTGVRRLPGPGLPEGPLDLPALDRFAQDLQRKLDEDSLPPRFLEDLGTNRQKLRDLIERYKSYRKEAPPDAATAGEPGATEVTDSGGRVMRGAGAAPGVQLADALPQQPDKDSLRSRFEAAADRLSPRYREAVNSYYKALSEQP
jgi:hypothetical protein